MSTRRRPSRSKSLAARGEDGDFADAVGFGEDAVAVGAEDLQAPEAGDEDGEDERDEVLGGVKLAGGQLLVAAVGAVRSGLSELVVLRFHG